MPQTSKVNSSAAGGPGQVSAPDHGEPPPPQAEPRDLASGDGGVGVDEDQGDLQINKSPSDPKKYRYIELTNGLRVLLISDFSGADGKDACREEEEEDGASGGGEEAEEEGDSGEGTEEEDEDAEEEHDSDFEELDEEQEGKQKKGSSEKQSAAALCISVGSFSDPEDLPGLAHFLEHMVFMGSEKYPAENGFDAFLKKHGGSDNASTDCERTIFQFDVQRKYFREALDRWAQFFICPLMIEDAIDREVEAVDSEYQLARPSDSHRKEMLFGSLARPKHPMGKFCWGNAQTLKHEPREKQINTYQRLRDFWKRYYSAHYMTLTVQSKVVPVRKVHALTVTWALPPQGKQYRVKPLHYISWLIGHEGAGSILSLLRKKCWALALFGGNSETGFDQNTTYSIFSISITLTDEGFQNFHQVVHLVFQYMKMLQTLGPQQRIYEEIQKIEANEFHYQEQTDPIEYVENICENMQLFPKEDFLTGDQLMFEYNPEVISLALALLTPERANLLLLSPEHEGHCAHKEKWFGTNYSIEDLPEEWAQRWAGDFDLNPDLHLPAENKFIATDFTLKPSDCPDTEVPVRIVNNERGCLWFKKDNKFKIPKAYVRFNLLSPMIQKSPENLVLFDVFVNILAHNLAEPAYEADVAQLEYKLIAGEHGLVIRVKGFNHKLPLLLNLIVDHLADFTAEPGVFNMFAEQLKKTYFNILIKPERLGKDVRLLILEHCRWSVIQKYQAIMKGLTVDDLMTFVSGLKAQLYTEGLVQGNFTSTESMKFLQYFIDKLQFKRLSVEVPVLFRVVELPQKPHLCKVKSLNKGDANSEVTVYYQSGLKNLREHTLMELLVVMLTDFNSDLVSISYQVYPTCRNTSGVLGFSITVETQATKFNTDYVENKIEEFLVSFGEKMTNLTDEAFKTQVTALIKLKECEDTHLGEEVDRNWFEVVTQQYVFDRLNREVRLYTVTAGWLSSRDTGGSCGPNPAEGDEDQGQALKTSSYGEVSKLTFLPASPMLADATLINDIRAFTSSLTLYPYHKILK
uniref:Nardilysin b (N-arginine dibasic convertase) n=1 Tax=Salmo trutta TaxID=8032 RepID=A0A673XX40_SALTR